MAAAAPAPEDDPLAQAIADAPNPDAPPLPPPPGGGDAPGAPVHPRGGPLRGQRLTPPPPAPAPAPHPGAPAPPPPAPLSFSDALASAQKNLLPSAASNISNTLHALAPWNWGEDAQGLWNIGQGLASKAGIIDQGNVAAQKQHQAAVDAIGKMYADRYGSWEGFKRTLANDPFAIGSDIATVATLPLGGEGLVSKVPDATEALLLAGAGAAKQGGTLSNALLNTAVHVPGAMRAAGAVAKPVLKTAQLGDPAYAASQILGGGLGAARAVGRIPIAGQAIRGAIGAGIGHTVGGMIPFVGHTGGTIIGEHIAEGLVPKTGPRPPGLIGRARPALPLVTTLGGTEAMSPTEQGQQGPAAAPGVPPPSAAGQGGGGGSTGDPLADAIADSGLEGPVSSEPASASAPSAGLQGGRGSAVGDPGNVSDVIRQAEGGYNQPVGYRPGGGSSARGAYQMTDGTYVTNLRKYRPDIAGTMSTDQIKAYRNTPAGWSLNAAMGHQMVQDEMAKLQNEGIAPTADAVGTLHMLGNTRLLHADPNTPIEQVTGADQREANAGIFRNIRTAGDFVAWMHRRNQAAASQLRPATYAADGGRVERQAGGQVIDLTERLLSRANAAQKAAQASTKPLLGLSDDTVAAALRVAQRGL